MRCWPILILAACAGDTSDTSGSSTPTGVVSSGVTGDTGPSCYDSPATIELGTGSDGFEALAELDPVEIVFGPQGGYHVLTAVRACHLQALITVHVQLVDELTGTQVSDVTYVAPTYEDDATCCRWRADMYGYLDTTGVPGIGGQSTGEYLHGKVLIYDMQVEDDLGHEASGTRRVTASFPGR